jgi:hypothetical protein
MDGSETFGEMDDLKKQMIDGEIGDGNWVPPDEHQEALEKAKKEARTELRNTFLAQLYNFTDLTGNEIADLPVVEVTTSRVRQLGNRQ